MPGNPRRTTELMGSTKRNTERKSRIAVPRGRSTLLGLSDVKKRPQSVDRYSSRANSLLPPASTAKTARSHSQTPRSAFLTPTTPANRTPLSNSYLHSVDKRGPVEDKLFIHQEAARISSFAIRHNVSGFGTDTKLRSVTYKQFTGLVEYMIETLVGNRLQGDIIKALQALDYPYTINRSWLKTPTAGHAFNHVVLMLGWLLNLIEPPILPGGETELDDIECLNNLVHDTEFPTIMYQKLFMEKAKEGFKMWNLRQDDLFEKLNDDLADMHIEQSTHSSIKSIKQLNEDIFVLKEEYKQLLSMAQPSSNYEQHVKLEKEWKDLKRILEGKHEIVKQFTESITTETEIYENEVKVLKQRELEITKLRSKIKSQTMSKEHMKQLIHENYLLRQTIEAEKRSTEQFSEQNESESVEVSRLIKQRVQKINELNQTIYSLFKNFENSLPNFNPVDYELHSNSSDIMAKLEVLMATLQNIKLLLNQKCDEYSVDRVNIKTANDTVSFEFEQHQKKLKQNAEKFALDVQAISKSLVDLDKKFTAVDEKYNKEKAENDNNKVQIAHIKAELETEKIAVSKLSEQKQITMARFLEDQEKMLDTLREQSKAAKDKVEHCKLIRNNLQREVLQKQKDLKETLKNFSTANVN